MTFARRLTILLSFFWALLPAFAQEQADTDSLVRLMSAQSVHIVEREGEKVREVFGPARFLHNNTYLVCDTAIWHVDAALINAYGHVQILQDETVLSSDELDYFVDEDRAEFRGSVVQLQDKDNNTLRTRYLDYNTKDSVAVFKNGASMRDKDGQIIESTDGTYDSKIKTFEFIRSVNMYVDSIFVRTDYMTFNTDLQLATFDSPIYAWQDDKMLSANSGFYDRSKEEFFFSGNVHAYSEKQEMWADSMYFYRALNNVELRHNAQVMDTTRNVTAVADYMLYVDSLNRMTMRDRAAIAAVTEQDNQRDTLYMGASLIIYDGIQKGDISPEELAASNQRLADMKVDPVAEYRKKNAQESKSEEESGEEPEPEEEPEAEPEAPEPEGEPVPEAEEAQPEGEPEPEAEAAEPAAEEGAPEAEPEVVESEPEPEPEPEVAELEADSLEAGADSLSVGMDSLAVELPPKDTTIVGLITATGNVKVYRKDIQAKTDSLVFFQLDSIARMYNRPVVWNEEGAHQYVAETISLLIADERLQQADLMTDAFVIIRENPVSFDQIKATEMMAYFDTSATLRRYDALGGASAIFYLEENGDFATVNKVESSMMSAYLTDGQLDRVYYFDNPKNNAYPVVKLPKEERELKGFNWREDERPTSRYDISNIAFRETERNRYTSISRPRYAETGRYFPGYMNSVYQEIARRDSLEAAAAAYRQFQADSLEMARAVEMEDLQEAEELARLDSLATMPLDSLKAGITGEGEIPDQAGDDGNVVGDDNGEAGDDGEITDQVGDDEVVAAEDGKEVIELDVKSLKDLERETKRLEQERLKAERDAAREARWAELDERDAAKAARKAEKAAAKERARKLKMIRAQEKRAAKEQKILDRYIKRYEKQKARRQRKDR
jgi:lipopolysaccharide export system protein LptA